MHRAWSADQVNRSECSPMGMSASDQARRTTPQRGRLSRQALYAQSLHLQSRDIISKNGILCGGQCYLTRERTFNLLLALCVFWGFWSLMPWGSAPSGSFETASASTENHEQRSSFQLKGVAGAALALRHHHLFTSHHSTSAHEWDQTHAALNGGRQAGPAGRSIEHGTGLHAARQDVAHMLAVKGRGAHESHATNDTSGHLRHNPYRQASRGQQEPFNMTSYLHDLLPDVAKKQRPFKCVSWRQTGNCSSHGTREPENDKPCHEMIPTGASGYCEVIEEGTNRLRQVMHMNCTSHPNSILIHGVINCEQAGEFAMFADESLQYRPPNDLRSQADQDVAEPQSRGIVFCVADSLLVSVYAAIRNLRRLGCLLPIELWYLPDELKEKPAIVKDLIYNFQVDLRPIPLDRSQLCHNKGADKCFNTKIYSIYHTK